ncbi:MAG: BMP family lipoprotein [Alphaproteobacteria bacterium]
MRSSILFAGVASLALTASANAEYLPAVIFDLGGINDKSFNESVYNGLEQWKADTGSDYIMFEVTDPSQREELMRTAAELGADAILSIGFAQADALTAVATDFPDIQFGAIDVGWVALPNVNGIVFKEHEGSFLVGMMAAMASESGVVSFVGGQDGALISAFECGYEQGAKYVNPDITVLANMIGNDGSAWANPTRAYELTVGHNEQGSDVAYAAAGFSGTGLMKAAADLDILSIGVDANQNYLYPGKVLTSMVKRVDVAAYNFFNDNMDGGAPAGGVDVLGLAEEGVGFALDDYNASLVSADMLAAVEAAQAAIIAGDLSVHDYRSNGSCDY